MKLNEGCVGTMKMVWTPARTEPASISRLRRKEHAQKGVVWNEKDQQVVNVTEGLIAMAPIVLSPASVRLSRCRIA